MNKSQPIFSPAALNILNRQTFDPFAVASYDMMSGGLYWPDEFPALNTAEWKVVQVDWVYRFLLGYRASLTLGKERIELRFAWQQVAQAAPGWPGLRNERRDEKARQRLLAAKRREKKCLSELE